MALFRQSQPYYVRLPLNSPHTVLIENDSLRDMLCWQSLKNHKGEHTRLLI